VHTQWWIDPAVYPPTWRCSPSHASKDYQEHQVSLSTQQLCLPHFQHHQTAPSLQTCVPMYPPTWRCNPSPALAAVAVSLSTADRPPRATCMPPGATRIALKQGKTNHLHATRRDNSCCITRGSPVRPCARTTQPGGTNHSTLHPPPPPPQPHAAQAHPTPTPVIPQASLATHLQIMCTLFAGEVRRGVLQSCTSPSCTG
jgi:hypothetical protein